MPIRSRANGEMAETRMVQVPYRPKRRSAERNAPKRNGREHREMIRIIVSTWRRGRKHTKVRLTCRTPVAVTNLSVSLWMAARKSDLSDGANELLAYRLPVACRGRGIVSLRKRIYHGAHSAARIRVCRV